VRPQSLKTRRKFPPKNITAETWESTQDSAIHDAWLTVMPKTFTKVGMAMLTMYASKRTKKMLSVSAATVKTGFVLTSVTSLSFRCHLQMRGGTVLRTMGQRYQAGGEVVKRKDLNRLNAGD